MLFHFFNNFEIQEYYQIKTKFNCFCSRNNLPKIKDGAYVINLDAYKSIAVYDNSNNVTYFDSFGVEHIPKRIKKIHRKQKYNYNYYRIQAYNWLICEYFCIGFIDSMPKDKCLLDYTNLLSLNDYK